jgi:N-acetylmuramoyl-L-alanine amidase
MRTMKGGKLEERHGRAGQRALFLGFLFFLSLFLYGAETLPAGPGKLLSLDDALAALTGEAPEFRWDPFMGSGLFSVSGHTAAFAAGEPGETGFLVVDGREVFTVPLPYLVKGLLFFPEEFVQTAGGVLARCAEEDASRFRIAAIIVDPGHGGKDPGAVGNLTVDGKALRSVEKDIVLNVSKQLYTLLSRAYPDKRILLTREGDTFPSLDDRVDLANSVSLKENEATIFISIHANSSFNKHARGYEVWYLDPEYRREVIDKSKYEGSAEVQSIMNVMLEEEFTTESIMMAQSILGRIGEAVGDSIPSRGIKAEEWFVVKNARMPAVLVELGFVTNIQDARLMADQGYLRKLAEALYKGVADFIGTFERSGGFTALR